MRSLDEISGNVLAISMRLHQALGPGMMESVYETVLAAKLVEVGYSVERQKAVPIHFEGHHFDNAFRIDLLVEARALIEIKSAERLNAAHFKQLLTYSQTHEPATQSVDQLWRGDAERRIPPHRQ